VDDIRLRVLRFFNADPDVYDLVFVANTTAGIKLVADTLRDYQSEGDKKGFWCGYHVDSHTSLVGVREVADQGHRCFESDREVQQWIDEDHHGSEDDNATRLFAYPAQSNMNGRRLPLQWCSQIRNSSGRNTFTLLDVASFVTTTPLDLSDPLVSPDFAVLSFYKIFGFPDLGALLVRKDVGHIFQHRRYFGGGTADMVIAHGGAQWHAKKQASIHDRLEDGTLPFHNIIALDSALNVHKRLYGSIENVSAHTSLLTQQLFHRLSSLKHANGSPVCHFYTSPGCPYGDTTTQGPIIALNLLDSSGKWIGKSEVEKLAAIKGIHIRSGTLCNPGGAASLLGLSNEDMEVNYRAGQRCGDENDVMRGKPTGALRLSLGAMSNSHDVDVFVSFVQEFYVDLGLPPTAVSPTRTQIDSPVDNRFYVESLCVYPIKSCSGFKVPPGVAWQVNQKGLAWDREWCIVHQGTGTALSQKRYPRMALIKPHMDFANRILRITTTTTSSSSSASTDGPSLDIPLSRHDDPQLVAAGSWQEFKRKSSRVCGDQLMMQVYSSREVSAFFSDFLAVPCTLARSLPHVNNNTLRHAKATATKSMSGNRDLMPGSFPADFGHILPPPYKDSAQNQSLSNDSPILLVSRSSVNRLNEQIKANSKPSNTTISTTTITTNKAVAADVFRANIVVAENLSSPLQQPQPAYSEHNTLLKSSGDPSRPSILNSEQPYIEDTWSSFTIGPANISFDVFGSCQRCQMVCVDQMTAEKREEPFSTLAKTRRIGGKVLFGRHAGLSFLEGGDDDGAQVVRVGDAVVPSYE
jgi:molybdenum cofactor sulfurtransferase